ncbi:MAG: protease inhibitor I42 family protein [Gammaproteobacteria bacterium]|nr:protease inhibitor I42 family protein [Gammaproteobacteria bacterium]MCP5196620.1 protease inhibitor I42 family protein [Gammaproteobacteria bacterium]
MSAICRLPSSRFRFVLKSFLLTLVAMFMIGCASQGDQPSASPVGVRENGVLIVTSADNNRTAELHVGERLEVRLPEDSSTGLKWAIDEYDRRILALDDTAYIPPVEVGFIGIHGLRTFTFTARQPGQAALKLKYWRVWGGDSSIKEHFAVTVWVIESGEKSQKIH